MKRDKGTYVKTLDKNGKVTSIQRLPDGSSFLEQWQRSCEENFLSFLLTDVIVAIVLGTVVAILVGI